MNESSTFARLSRGLDWAGLLPATIVLGVGIRDYRDGGSVGWPIGGALILLGGLWAIYRGRRRQGLKDGNAE
ncbi:hypothetical protein [Streptomyces graminilatus]|uniref:hypothetical protein n=1 Tax=Streptomyces graminilatus TaxID=1464070 RepID=UPI0006E35E62|nr:hypothetical protein [Streptomyces graminilatus]